MVASHSFDILGARHSGFRAAYVNRYDLPYDESDFEPDIIAFAPRCIIVTCNVVQDTILAGERLKLLQSVTNDMKPVRHDTIQYNFLHDEYVDLRTHEFDRIRIRICDVTGKVLQTHDN